MTAPITTTTPVQMNAQRPNVGIVPTPPVNNAGTSLKSKEIMNSKAPNEIKTLGNRKKPTVPKIISGLYVGIAAITGTITVAEIVKFIKKIKRH